MKTWLVSAWWMLIGCGASAPTHIETGPAATAEMPSQAPEAPASQNAGQAVDRYAAIVAAADRSDDDRKLDAGRHPAELLAFIDVQPGMRVAEISAGGGYTSELLARAVDKDGVVYGHNSPFVLQRFAEGPWSARLQKPVMQNVTRLDREFEAPFPDDVRDLDAVVDVLFYHDTYWQGVDRDKMNQAIFAALKPGGVYVIVDHSARPGDGASQVKTLHRVEESLVRDEILRAGFTLAAEASFLRNPNDTRDWNASPSAAGAQRGTSDRFVYKFVKPAAGS